MRTRYLWSVAALAALGASGCCMCGKNVNSGIGVEVYGRLDVAPVKDGEPPAKIVVAAYPPDHRRVFAHDTVKPYKDKHGEWRYGLIVPPGKFELMAFAAGKDQSGVSQADLVGRALVEVPAADSAATTRMLGPTIPVPDPGHPTDAGFEVDLEAALVPTLRKSLSDPFFDPVWGDRGMILPTWLQGHLDNQYLFGLGDEPPEVRAMLRGKARARALLRSVVKEEKVQVLFVHGVKGTPRSFAALVETLDPARYQPWFFYYPTGFGLEAMGEKLAATVRELAESKAPAKVRVLLVAHSMGGLVSREAIKRLAEEGGDGSLGGFVSLATSYGGIAKAEDTLKIPDWADGLIWRQAWYDVAPSSPFMKQLYQGAYPQQLPFYLFWGNLVPGGGDGTVSCESATDPNARSRARETCHFDLNHTGVLGDGDMKDFARLKAAFVKAVDLAGEPNAPAGAVCPNEPPVETFCPPLPRP